MHGTGWVKSSLSFANGNCVEAQARGLPGGQVQLRNSRFPEVQLPPFTGEEWAAFMAGVRAGEFDEIGQSTTSGGWPELGGARPPGAAPPLMLPPAADMAGPAGGGFGR
jgi:hypothetical protein